MYIFFWGKKQRGEERVDVGASNSIGLWVLIQGYSEENRNRIEEKEPLVVVMEQWEAHLVASNLSNTFPCVWLHDSLIDGCTGTLLFASPTIITPPTTPLLFFPILSLSFYVFQFVSCFHLCFILLLNFSFSASKVHFLIQAN